MDNLFFQVLDSVYLGMVLNGSLLGREDIVLLILIMALIGLVLDKLFLQLLDREFHGMELDG
ncbi:MAG: hypothetical protein EBR59_08920 [Methylococcaceae bacterium]|nr:hypothetical protein [Methylococcaceae bacterium]